MFTQVYPCFTPFTHVYPSLNQIISFLVETFVKNINDGEDMFTSVYLRLKMLTFAATLTEKWKRKQIISFLVETFVKSINDGEDMR